MAKLVFSVLESLDGYIADEAGRFDWAAPDEEVHTFVNDLQRPFVTQLYGRRTYEVMSVWETLDQLGDQPAFIEDFATTWRAASKIVYSKTLDVVSSSHTRIERNFDPESIRRMKRELSGDIAIGGANLAAQAIAEGLVDEYQLFVAPVAVGGGTRSLPSGIRIDLELMHQRRFANGMVYLNYRAT